MFTWLCFFQLLIKLLSSDENLLNPSKIFGECLTQSLEKMHHRATDERQGLKELK